MARFTTIIPYFQREEGILVKSVLSALEQGYSDNHIIVVDDGSPTPARKELEKLLGSHRDKITLIEQANGGAGSARNRGLDAVAEDCKYVAFLDSDDQWFPGHLDNAVHALEQGYDFYFSDFYFSDYKQQTAFKRAGKITPTDHQPLAGGSQLYAYNGNMHDQIIITGNIIGTSNVVYRFAEHNQLRFREEFYNGQDYMFWLDLSARTDKIAFSSDTECDCGRGINIYAGAGWGTEGSLNRLKNEIKLWSSVKRIFDLSTEQSQANNQHLSQLRESVVLDILHRLRHKKPLQAIILKEFLHYDKGLLFAFIPILIRRLTNKKQSHM